MQDRRLIDYNEYGGSDNTARSNAVWRSFAKAQQRFAVVMNTRIAVAEKGLLRALNPGPLAPEARIIPLDQAAIALKSFQYCLCNSLNTNTANSGV